MLKLKNVMKQFNIKQAQLAKHIEFRGNCISQAVINLIVNRNIWPRSIERDELEQKIGKALIKLGLNNDYLLNIFEEETGAENVLADESAPVDSNEKLTKESAYMLLRKQTINRDARARQMHELLKNSALSGRKHLLIIEEAHGLPIPTLKHLKRFYELQEGFKKLLSIILIGQTELQTKLSEYNPEVREVVQRCEVVNIKPLDFKVEEYIKHKFARVDMDYTALFDASAFNEIIKRLRVASNRRGEKQVRSLCYPLAVNNLVSNALNLAARIGSPTVTGEIIIECIKERGDM